jgi:hypothetical protein
LGVVLIVRIACTTGMAWIFFEVFFTALAYTFGLNTFHVFSLWFNVYYAALVALSTLAHGCAWGLPLERRHLFKLNHQVLNFHPVLSSSWAPENGTTF